MRLKQALAGKLSKKELSFVPTSFDVIGDIAVFNDFPKQIKKRETLIAATLLSLHPHITTVAKKTGRVAGRLRTPKLSLLAGERKKETTHRENGCVLKLHVESCYFSPRLAAERLRIAKQVRKNEEVLVLFSGVSPYPCVIAKNASPRSVYGVELNARAHEYALENVQRNKLHNIKLFKGDAKRILRTIKKKFDRIIMPLPKDSLTYLPFALKKLKQKGTVHLYLFARQEEFPKTIREYKKSFKKVSLVPCGAYAPHVFRICLDLSTPIKK